MLDSNVTQKAFEKLLQIPENKCCFECGSTKPTWASLPNAIFLCYNCSGLHRGIGMNLSFVRSLHMDAWTQPQLQMMLLGGNRLLKEYFASVGVYNTEENAKSPAWKYKTRAGLYYREKVAQSIHHCPDEGLGRGEATSAGTRQPPRGGLARQIAQDPRTATPRATPRAPQATPPGLGGEEECRLPQQRAEEVQGARCKAFREYHYSNRTNPQKQQPKPSPP